MTVSVTPGPVPTDGDRIVIEDAMTDFVKGTQITGFGLEEFVDAPVNFVVSSTDPPATDNRTKSTLWFARGEGKLYRWLAEPIRSADYAPSDASDNVSEAMWVAMSDRKELIVHAKWGVKQGEFVTSTRGVSDHKIEPSTDYGSRPRYTYVVSATANSNGSDGQGVAFGEQVMTSMAALWDPVFVALEDAAHTHDGTYTKVCEFGFCKAFVEGAPGPGNQPAPAMWMSDKDPHYVAYSTDYTSWTNTAAILGYIGGVPVPNGEAELMTVFLCPEISNYIRPPNIIYNVLV